MDKFEQERLDKLQKLRKMGIEPYGKRYDNTQPIKSILDSFVPERTDIKVRAAGRISTLRPHGKTAFLDIRDWTGKIQREGFHLRCKGISAHVAVKSDY